MSSKKHLSSPRLHRENYKIVPGTHKLALVQQEVATVHHEVAGVTLKKTSDELEKTPDEPGLHTDNCTDAHEVAHIYLALHACHFHFIARAKASAAR